MNLNAHISYLKPNFGTITNGKFLREKLVKGKLQRTEGCKWNATIVSTIFIRFWIKLDTENTHKNLQRYCVLRKNQRIEYAICNLIICSHAVRERTDTNPSACIHILVWYVESSV